MEIVTANKDNFNEWVRMALLLWPNHTEKDLRTELELDLTSSSQTTFLCKDEGGKFIGFQTVSLRKEYVPGAKSSPVAYLEGIYVEPDYRHQGIARKLHMAAENWAKENGCTQIASDTWDWNQDSIKFHEKLGFTKTKTLVHFIKPIN